MKRTAALLIPILIGACTAPNSSDLSELATDVEQMRADQRELVVEWATSGIIYQWLNDRRDIPFGVLECTNKATGEIRRRELLIVHLVDCLEGRAFRISSGFQDSDFAECIDLIGTALGSVWPDMICRASFSQGFSYESIRDAAVADYKHRVASAHATMFMITAVFLLQSPTPPPALVPIRQLLPTLCGMGVSWGCPDDPLYPGKDQPTTTTPPEGDAQ